MITKENYFEQVKELGLDGLPEGLVKAHRVIEASTEGGQDWSLFDEDEEFQRLADETFGQLTGLLQKIHLDGVKGKSEDSPVIKRAKQDAEDYQYMELRQLRAILQMEKMAEMEDGLTEEIKIRKTALERIIPEKEKQEAEEKKFDEAWGRAQQFEEQAQTPLEFAKALIMGYVLRGFSVEVIKKSQTAVSKPEFEARIVGDEIIVVRIGQKGINKSFPLKEIYGKIKEEEGANLSGKKVLQTPRDAAKALIRTCVHRGDSLDSLRGSALGYAGTDYHAQIRGNKIQVDLLNGKVVNDSFDLAKIYNEVREEKSAGKVKVPRINLNKERHKKASEIVAKETERISEEVRFVRRLLAMNSKKKTKDDILRYINALQKAILEKRIRKSSPYSKEIKFIQENLVKQYNGMKAGEITVQFRPETVNKLQKISKSERVLPSVGFLKRYIGLQGKRDIQKRANNLLLDILKALERGKIAKGDKYRDLLKECANECNEISTKPRKAALPLSKQELRGTPNQIMSSTEFAKLKFDTIGFTGKWLGLIGDPCRGFTAMVFGKPKMGKSYLCVDFAGYLARNHGKVLYVAKEEKLDKTLQDKLKGKDVAHENLFVSDFLPTDLSAYDFVFLDSVNKIGLSPKYLEELKAKNQGRSFIFIFQTTKEGNFRGANEFQHDVDVVIEVPEKGKAVQFGRFNQGGEMDIFGETSEEKNALHDSLRDGEGDVSLEGVKKKKMEKSRKSIGHYNITYKYVSDNPSLIKRGTKVLDDEGNERTILETFNKTLRLNGNTDWLGINTVRFSEYDTRPDELNPKFLFSLTPNQLLAEALRKDFDVYQLIREQLANRGLDEEGKWVGFDKAYKIHKIDR